MVQDFFAQLTAFVAGLATWQQVLALVPAGAIPFIESYLGSFLGILVGIHPAIAIPAAVLGNVLATFGVIALSGRARDAVTGARSRASADAEQIDGAQSGQVPADGARPAAGSGRFRSKVASALEKYGVPGVCLLGPLLLASQITAPILVALGVAKGRIYLWMGISIVLWGLAFGLFGGVLTSVGS